MRNKLLSYRRYCVFSIDRPPTIATATTTTTDNGIDTGVKIYNCIVRKKVPLIIRNKNLASWYTCGPTVYDSTHIGHASCYVKLDILQRIMRDYLNINLITAMNITDIDDKIIRKSNENHSNWKTISKQYENEFWDDLKRLGVREPNIKIRVTENIPEIIEFIKKLLDEKLAYIGDDKSVYFDTSKYSSYGKLQRINLGDQSINNEHNESKYTNYDFALWKAQKNINEPAWSTPWGSDGRPGWHIECSTLCSKIFGKSIDFHAGGIDLKFPHHENEEAQSCSYHKTDQWVVNWIHAGHLNMKGQEKMSKSLKNTVTVAELLTKYSSSEFRMACALSNYRSSMEFSDESMLNARNTLSKLISFKLDCKAYFDGKKSGSNFEITDMLTKLSETNVYIDSCIKDDFNTAKCIGGLLELAGIVSKYINNDSNSSNANNLCMNPLISAVVAADNFVSKIMNMLGFDYEEESTTVLNDNSIDSGQMIDEILDIRSSIRLIAVSTKNKDLYDICDNIRENLRNKYVNIKDHSKGSSWNYIPKN